MNRRGFFGALAAIFASRWMPAPVRRRVGRHFVLSPAMHARMSKNILEMFRRQQQFAAHVNRDYAKDFPVGNTVNAKLPQRYRMNA